MDFYNTWVLSFLPLSLLPILLHLFFHRRKNTMDFSSLIFFEKKKHYFAFRRHLLEVLLLLCRALIIALVIFALARPCFKRFAFLKKAGIEMVIILDDTMSMQRPLPGGTTAFDSACRQAENLLNTISGNDGSGLIFLSGKKGIPITRDKEKVRKALRSVEITAASGSFASALSESAEQLERAPGLNREICIFSDFQKTAIPQRKLVRENMKKVRVYLAKTGTQTENLALFNNKPDYTRNIPGLPIRIPYSIRNFSPKERMTHAVLEINGKNVQTNKLTIPPNGTSDEAFFFTPGTRGRITGTISIQDGIIPLDDRLSFSFNVSDAAKAAFFYQEGTPDPWFHLRSAIDPRPNDLPLYGIRAVKVPGRQLSNLRKGEYDAVFLPQNLSLSRDAAQALLHYVKSGGSVFMFPETGGSARFFRDLSDYTVGAFPLLYEKKNAGKSNGLRFGKPFSLLNENLQLDLIQWKHLTPPITKGTTVLAYSGKIPLIVQRKIENGNLFLFASGLRRADTNWTELKSFPIVILELIKKAALRTGRTIQSECGSIVQTDALSFTNQSGKVIQIRDGHLQMPWLPAVLPLSGGNDETAVALSALRESDLEQMADSGIKNAFGLPVTILDQSKPIDVQIQQLRRGTELTGVALLLALFLMGIEFLLGAKPPVFRIDDNNETEDEK